MTLLTKLDQDVQITIRPKRKSRAELKAIGKDLFVDYWENVPLKSDPIRPDIL